MKKRPFNVEDLNSSNFVNLNSRFSIMKTSELDEVGI